jgi:hypothetical protein
MEIWAWGSELALVQVDAELIIIARRLIETITRAECGPYASWGLVDSEFVASIGGVSSLLKAVFDAELFENGREGVVIAVRSRR